MKTKLRKLFKTIVPELKESLHKGQCGRICIVGGCEEYTGSPYFAAISTLKLGADLSHIICDINAGTAIKSYSPELIVHPYLRTSDSKITNPVGNKSILKRVIDLLPHFHCIVAGPGMGRDEVIFQYVRVIIENSRSLQLPIVLDGDALYWISFHPDLVRGYANAILTPNHNEYKRLCNALNLSEDTPVNELAKAFGGVTIIQKGPVDKICNGDESIVICDEVGGNRRFGGQGDVLAGALGCFITWLSLNPNSKDTMELRQAACMAACSIARMACRSACAKYGRSASATNLIEYLPNAFQLFLEG